MIDQIEIFEKRVVKLAGVKKKEKSNDRFDFEPREIEKYLGGEAKSGSFNMFDLIAKAIGSKNQKYNNNQQSDDIPFDLPIELFVPEITSPNLSNFSKGFIPNFAPPISILRIPWFKKYANPSFDAKQPTLNIAGAGVADTFSSTQFRTNKTDYNKKAGDGNVFGPIYEKFVRSSMSLQANKSKIKSLI